VPVVVKSGSLNLLEPSGPVQAYNGIALTFFTFTFIRLGIFFLKIHFNVTFFPSNWGMWLGRKELISRLLEERFLDSYPKPTDMDGVSKPHNVTQAML